MPTPPTWPRPALTTSRADPIPATPARGRLLVGTSGFAYPAWAPRFYSLGLRGDALLPHYATRFPAVELNNTFYQRPSVARIRAWVAATPADFRFVVKAQRGAAMRALGPAAAESVAWLTEGLETFGGRLGAVLFRIPANVQRRDDGTSDAAIRRFLAAWPSSGMPLVVELQHASWHVDETFAALRDAGATLCATELPEDHEPPTIRVTGSCLYLRLRRHDYGVDEIASWAARLAPFLEAGLDAFVFFRHDEAGRATELADELRAALGGG